jgi:hypothetical protein
MQELIKILDQILADCTHRKELIKDFQNKIWNDKFVASDEVKNIFKELAYDLDFYEPNPKIRKEDSSFYGDDKLLFEVGKALDKIKNLPQNMICST